MYFETKKHNNLVQVVQQQTMTDKIDRWLASFNQPVPGWVEGIVFGYIVVFCICFTLLSL